MSEYKKLPINRLPDFKNVDAEIVGKVLGVSDVKTVTQAVLDAEDKGFIEEDVDVLVAYLADKTDSVPCYFKSPATFALGGLSNPAVGLLQVQAGLRVAKERGMEVVVRGVFYNTEVEDELLDKYGLYNGGLNVSEIHIRGVKTDYNASFDRWLNFEKP